MINSLRLTKSVFQCGKRFFFTKLAHIFILFAFGLFFTSCTHFAKDRTNKTASALALKLSILKPQKDFDGWLDFDINQFSILLWDRDSLRAHLIRNGEARPIANDELPKGLTKGQSSYEFTTFQGEAALALYYNSEKLSKDKLAAVNLLYFAIHEGFHAFYQQNNNKFQQHPTLQTRGDFYPILEQPRYFRREMYRSLLRYLKTSDSKSLNAFSWWYFSWLENHKEESSNTTDRTEGSAEYYTNQALTKIYNNKTESELTPFQHFQKVLQRGKNKYEQFALDKEAYLLGPLAGIILDRLQNKTWKEQVNKKDSPLFILARMYKPLKQPVDLKLKEEYLLMSVKKMQEIDQNGVLDQTVTSLATPSTIRLALANGPETKLGGFAPDGFYRSFFEFKDSKGINIIPLKSNMLIHSPGLEIELAPKSVLVLSQKNPCAPQGGPLFLFPPQKVEIKDREVKTLAEPQINHKARKIIQRSGITWVCLN